MGLTEATYLMPAPERLLSTEDLIAQRAIELQKQQGQLATLHSRVYRVRVEAAQKFKCNHTASIRNFDFKPRALVLMQHTQIEKSLNCKMRPRYTGPLVVVSCNRGGAYVLCELDGTVLHQPVAAFRVILYLAREAIPLPEGFADISGKRLHELVTSENDGTEDPEPEVLDEPPVFAGPGGSEGDESD